MILELLCAIYVRIQLSHNHYISIFHNFCINMRVIDYGMGIMEVIDGIEEMMVICLFVFKLVAFYDGFYLDIDFHQHLP